MSIVYCHKCDNHIDTDFNTEHFEEIDGKIECEDKQQQYEYRTSID